MNLLKFLRKAIEPQPLIYETPDGIRWSYVEKQGQPGEIRMGIKLHSGQFQNVIFTTSPRISFREFKDPADGETKVNMDFQFFVEKLPSNLDAAIIDDPALRRDVASVILQIVDDEYNKKNNADRGTNPIGAGE